MTEFQARRGPSIPGRGIQSIAKSRVTPLTGIQKRRGVRVNSQVPVTLEWNSGGNSVREAGQTRVVGPYGCMAVVPLNLDVKQTVQLTNMVSKETNRAVIVWRGHERMEGWELGIELVNPQMDFWGFDL